MADDLYGAEGAAAPAGPRRLRRGHQPVHLRGAHRPDQAALRVRRDRQAARGLAGHRRDRDRLAGRRHLRQGRRRRARSAARARGGQGPLRRRRRRAGLAGLPPPRRPRGPDHREERQRLVRLSAHHARTGRRRAARRGLARGPAQQRREPARRRPRRAARTASASSAAMSNALLDLGRGVGVRPPGRRDGPAGRLLHAADPGRDGPARPRHRRRGRGVRRHQPVRAAGPRPGLRLVGDLGGPGHHRHVRREALRAGRLRAGRAVDALPLQGRVPRDGDPHARRTTSRPTRATRRRPRPTRCRRSAPCTASCSKRGTVDGQPVAFAKQRSTYFHEADSARAFSRAEPARRRCRTPRTSSASCTRSTSRSTGSTPTTATSPTSTPATTRSAPTAPTPTCPNWGTGEYDWKGWETHFHSSDVTPFEEHPQVVNQDYITSWNNKQAPGYDAADGQWGYGPHYRSQSLDEQIEPAARGRRQDEPRRGRSTRWSSPAPPTCAAPRCCRCCSRWSARPATRSCAAPSASCRTGSIRARTGSTRTRTASTTTRTRSRSWTPGGRGCSRPSSSRRWGPTSSRRCRAC